MKKTGVGAKYIYIYMVEVLLLKITHTTILKPATGAEQTGVISSPIFKTYIVSNKYK